MARVFIGIGSNIERESSIRAAVQALRARFGLLMLSNVYESRPIGFEGGNFYNLVAAFDADEPPEAVIATLHDIEQRLGRERATSRYTSRTIDLDLLLYGDLGLDDLLRRNRVAPGLGHFHALGIHGEAMGEHGFVRRGAMDRDRRQQ